MVISLSLQSLEYAYWTAGANWKQWEDDFEFSGPANQLPVLCSPDRFYSFTKEYSVLRYRKKSERDDLRSWLNQSERFLEALQDPEGQGIECLAEEIRCHFPKFNTERSCISKLASFARPANFVPWDRYARIGTSQLTSGPNEGAYKSYPPYLKSMNKVIHGALGTRVKIFLEDKEIPTHFHEAFVVRVIDVVLMIRGGRWREFF